jgi:DNA polymerase III epsilon subunit-like protein
MFDALLPATWALALDEGLQSNYDLRLLEAPMALPEKILFVDVETTGLASSDRIVSLGFISLLSGPLETGILEMTYGHMIFDPGRESHPKAEEVHGYSDWTLRHQDPFETKAMEIRPLFLDAGLVVAHNAVFDGRFIEAEFRLAGCPLPSKTYFCTMESYRERVGGRAGLDAALAVMGLARTGKKHGALEDAWMAMMVFLWLHKLPMPAIEHMPRDLPTNWKEVPSKPRGSIPKRSNRLHEDYLGENEFKGQFRRILTTARPLAVLIMWVARSDELVAQETAVVQQLVRSVSENLGISENPQMEQDISAILCELEPTPEMVDTAVRIVARRSQLRDQLGSWIRKVTYADGKGTQAEKSAIERIHLAL